MIGIMEISPALFSNMAGLVMGFIFKTWISLSFPHAKAFLWEGSCTVNLDLYLPYFLLSSMDLYALLHRNRHYGTLPDALMSWFCILFHMQLINQVCQWGKIG